MTYKYWNDLDLKKCYNVDGNIVLPFNVLYKGFSKLHTYNQTDSLYDELIQKLNHKGRIFGQFRPDINILNEIIHDNEKFIATDGSRTYKSDLSDLT